MHDQGWFEVTLNTELMMRKFGTHLFPVNSYTIMGFYPQIMKTYGTNEELDISLSLDRTNVTFGPTPGTDVKLETIVKMGVR